MKGNWFGPKLFCIGIGPRTWQGLLVIAVYRQAVSVAVTPTGRLEDLTAKPLIEPEIGNGSHLKELHVGMDRIENEVAVPTDHGAGYL